MWLVSRKHRTIIPLTTRISGVMGSAQVDLVHIFEAALALILLITIYGWYLMFGAPIALGYGVTITTLLLGYYYVTYQRY